MLSLTLSCLWQVYVKVTIKLPRNCCCKRRKSIPPLLPVLGNSASLERNHLLKSDQKNNNLDWDHGVHPPNPPIKQICIVAAGGRIAEHSGGARRSTSPKMSVITDFSGQFLSRKVMFSGHKQQESWVFSSFAKQGSNVGNFMYAAWSFLFFYLKLAIDRQIKICPVQQEWAGWLYWSWLIMPESANRKWVGCWFSRMLVQQKPAGQPDRLTCTWAEGRPVFIQPADVSWHLAHVY